MESCSNNEAFADIQDYTKEHAEHTGANVGNIAHQREHFDMHLPDDKFKINAVSPGFTKTDFDNNRWNRNRGRCRETYREILFNRQ